MRVCEPLTNFNVPSAPVPPIFKVAPVTSPLKPLDVELLVPPIDPLKFKVFWFRSSTSTADPVPSN